MLGSIDYCRYGIFPELGYIERGLISLALPTRSYSSRVHFSTRELKLKLTEKSPQELKLSGTFLPQES